MVSTLVLDVDALVRLRELLGGLPLPARFAPAWDRTADADRIALARAEATARLHASGLLVPPPAGSVAASGDGSPDQVHPAMRAALAAFAVAGLRVDVRSWAGDRAVVADLAVGTDAGVGLARLQRVTGDGTAEDALGVELAIFSPDEILAAIERLLPAFAAPPADRAPIAPVRMTWPDGLALLDLLGRQDSIGPDQLPVAREVLRILLGSAGLSAVPALLDRLTGPLEAAVRITVSAPGRTGPDDIWFGYWLQCGGQLVALRAEPTDPEVSPDASPEARLDLIPTDAAGLRTDLLLALTAARPALTRGGSR